MPLKISLKIQQRFQYCNVENFLYCYNTETGFLSNVKSLKMVEKIREKFKTRKSQNFRHWAKIKCLLFYEC